MERISWTDAITNMEVLRSVGESRKIVDTRVKRKKSWVGHGMRVNMLLREVMDGRMLGKRGPGRTRIRI